ncbi:hypothetical protein ACOCJL_03485 [Acinetobacter baumannii]|uniref:hypothetical protein n=1 Tax=Acinetobacter baumannii TaxID=470 RepID=UPI003B43B5F2
MDHFIDALEKSIETENWYSVLFISLSLPDICGKIDEPNENSSKQRTINWFNKYIKPYYTVKYDYDQNERIFLSGADFYALRCAYLHEGSNDITNQRAQETLDKFQFIQPIANNGVIIHQNLNGKILQLQVSEFGKEIIAALKIWSYEISGDSEKIDKVNKLLNIEIINI